MFYQSIKSLIYISLLVVSTAVFANGVERGGTGGGEGIVPEFRSIGESIYKRIKDLPLYKNHFKVPMKRFERIIQKANLIPTNREIIINGDHKAAENNYKDTIWINSTQWNSINSIIIKKRLVFHEYLSLIGMEWNNYYLISNTLYNSELLPPNLVDLGIYKRLNRIEVEYALLMTPEPVTDLSESLMTLRILYQFSIEETVAILKLFTVKPSELESQFKLRSHQINIQEIINRIRSFGFTFRQLYELNLNQEEELSVSELTLRNVQSVLLTMQVSQFIDSSNIFKKYVATLNQRNNRDSGELKKQLEEINYTYSIANTALGQACDSEIISLNEMKNGPLSLRNKRKVHFLLSQFQFTRELINNP